MNQDLPWLEEELAAQSQWVRRLARSLVHDEAAAEDLVQDTWVAALRRPPADRRALRGWLARVVRTHAWKQQRKAASAPTTGVTGDHPGGAPESELVERLELHRVLAEELRALREPLRTTLLQRYFEGLSAAEIAERTGVPAATVRWRLQQGLEELRTRLDRRHHGSRTEWTSAFGALLIRHGATQPLAHAAGAAALPILAMSTLAKFSLAIAALAVVGIGFVAWNRKPLEPGLARGPAEQIASPQSPMDVATRAGESSRTPAAPEIAAPAASREGSVSAQDPATTMVDARCLDSALQPLASAWMRCVERDGTVASADSEGRIEFTFSLEKPKEILHLAVGAPGMATRVVEMVLQRGAMQHAGEFVLAPGGCVFGRIEDESGRPLEGASVMVLPLANDPDGVIDELGLRSYGPRGQELAVAVRTSADGNFVADGLALQRSRAWAHFEEGPWSRSEPLEWSADHDLHDVVLRVAAGNSTNDIDGVLLAPDGHPIAGAYIGVHCMATGTGWMFQVETDSHGRFVIHPKADLPHDLSASVSDRRWPSIERKGVAPGTKGLELRFEVGRHLAVRVRSRGAPVTKFAIGAGGQGGDCGSVQIPVPYATDRPEGNASVLVPATPFCLAVDAPGFWLKSVGPLSPADLPEVFEVELDPLPGVRGRVLADGRPIAGAKVQLNEVNEPGTFTEVNEFPSFVRPYTDWKSETGADGSFFIPLRDPGTYRLYADAPGLARGELGPLAIDVQKGLRDLELLLLRGGALHGHVLMPPGRSPEGVIVGLNRGDALPHTQSVGPDGAFAFEHLTPGRWRLARSRLTLEMSTGLNFSNGDGERVLETNCEVLDGQAITMDLDLREDHSCRLTGVVTLNGSPAAGWSIELDPVAQQHWFAAEPKAVIDQHGRFELIVETLGPVRAKLSAPVELHWRGEILRPIDVNAGGNAWTCDLHAGSVSGRWTGDLAAAPQLYCRTKPGADFEVRYHWIQLDKEGAFLIPIVPTGVCEIVARTSGPPPTERVVETFTLAAGEKRELALH
jgi:RNA polymerase sigma-70 factor (ECF subfamily)